MMMNEFDYKGFSEKRLLELCDKRRIKTSSGLMYWTTSIYSIGYLLKKYAFYPQFLPLFCCTDHGFDEISFIQQHEIDNNAPVILFYMRQKIENYRKNYQKPCYPFCSPMIWYRRNKHINQLKNTKGTLFFFQHNCPDISSANIPKSFLDKILSLPDEYHPICICLHMHDIDNGIYKIFLDAGFPVYTAGNTSDKRFAERWYKLVRHFKYTAGNGFGSHVILSVEMGIPFFLFATESVNYKVIEKGAALPEFYFDKNNNLSTVILPEMQQLFAFSGRKPIITPEQKERVIEISGMNTGLSRFQMAKVLYAAYFSRNKPYMVFVHLFISILRFIYHTIIPYTVRNTIRKKLMKNKTNRNNTKSTGD